MTKVHECILTLNIHDFMKLGKEVKFQREKLYFWIKHHIYLYKCKTVFELTVSNQSRQSVLK